MLQPSSASQSHIQSKKKEEEEERDRERGREKKRKRKKKKKENKEGRERGREGKKEAINSTKETFIQERRQILWISFSTEDQVLSPKDGYLKRACLFFFFIKGHNLTLYMMY